MKNITCTFEVIGIIHSGLDDKPGEHVRLLPVGGATNEFSIDAQPIGEMAMLVNNPESLGFFQGGAQYKFIVQHIADFVPPAASQIEAQVSSPVPEIVTDTKPVHLRREADFM